MKINIRFTNTFEKQFKRYKKKFVSITADLQTLLADLDKEPKTNLGGGFYKYRLAVKSKNTGKSGGFRVITFEVVVSATQTEKNATLVTIFDKSEKVNISTATLKSILAKEGLS